MTQHPEPRSQALSTDDRTAGVESRSAVWTRHWATGASHSCPGTYGELYGGAIATFWREVLSPLQRGQNVLDIATGNGALPRLLLGQHHEIEVDAIDIAAVEPSANYVSVCECMSMHVKVWGSSCNDGNYLLLCKAKLTHTYPH